MKKYFLVFVGIGITLLAITLLMSDTDCGVEWINEYPVCGFNGLNGRDNVAMGFYNTMTANGYTGRFAWGNSAAWGSDFADSDVVSWGEDHIWVDTVDICYHADHGNVGMFGFGVAHPNCIIYAEDCRWGDDYDLEWIILDDCSCLRHGQYGVWWPVFQKLHMILSFDTNASDDGARGGYFADKLVQGWSLMQAWFYACDQTQGPSTYAAIAGACNGDTSIYHEKVWLFGYVAPDPIPLAWWWWINHQC